MSTNWRAYTVFVIAAAAAACGPSGSVESAAPPPARTVGPTFSKNVAPIFLEHCASCHRPIEGARQASGDPICFAGAPFSLVEYRDARDHGRQIADAVGRRSMPPWLPDRHVGTFVNARGLRDDQIATIEQWVRDGMPEGNREDLPAPPKWPDGWQLGKPDLVLQLPQTYTLQATGSDVFRNFIVPVPVASTRYIRGIEFQAGNPRSLHHVSVGVDRFRVSRKADRADPGPGFAAMPDDRVENVYGWTPGKAPYMGPPDRAWVLYGGSDLVMQLHMLPTGTPEPIRPSIGLFFAERPPTRLPLQVKLESKTIDIPAGERAYVVEDRYVLAADVEVLSIYPHAHYLAKDIKGDATLPDGTVKPLIWIPSWDFRWQDQYRYAEPVSLPKGTMLSMRFTYDNSDDNPHNPRRPAQHVKWGPQSTDEMGALWVEILPRRDEDATVLTRDFEQRSLRADTAGAEVQVRVSPRDPLAHNFLATKYLQAGRVDDAIVQLEEALRLSPSDAEAHSNLATAILQRGRLPEALQHASEAVRLAPGDDRAHFNYANILNVAGRPDEAIHEFESALKLDADNADAHFNLAVMLGPRNRIDEAIQHLQKAIAINPNHAEAHRNLAVAYGLQGRIDDAIREDQAVLRLQPESAAAKEHLGRLLVARSARGGR